MHVFHQNRDGCSRPLPFVLCRGKSVAKKRPRVLQHACTRLPLLSNTTSRLLLEIGPFSTTFRSTSLPAWHHFCHSHTYIDFCAVCGSLAKSHAHGIHRCVSDQTADDSSSLNRCGLARQASKPKLNTNKPQPQPQQSSTSAALQYVPGP